MPLQNQARSSSGSAIVELPVDQRGQPARRIEGEERVGCADVAVDDAGVEIVRNIGAQPVACERVAGQFAPREIIELLIASDLAFPAVDLPFEEIVGAPEIFETHRPIIDVGEGRSEEHTSELQSLMRNSYAVCCLKKIKTNI